MRVIDKETGEVICEAMTNHSMSLDEVLDCCGLTVDEEGKIKDGGQVVGWYDLAELVS